MASLLVMAMYGFLFTPNYRVDSIIKLIAEVDEFNDIELGRFGIVYLNRLFGMQQYNPYQVAFLTMVMVVVTSVALVYGVWRVCRGRCGSVPFLLPLLIYLTPNWTEQLYFSYQTFLVLLGVMLTMLSAWLAYVWMEEKKKWQLPGALLLLAVAFSIYQSFVPLYIALGVGLFLLECLNDPEKDAGYMLRNLLGHMIVAGGGLAVYYIANKIAQIGAAETNYLSKQFLWASVPLHGVITSILRSMWSVIGATGLVDTPVYTISAIASLVMMLIGLGECKSRMPKPITVAAWLGLQVSAFALMIALGSRTYIRTELAITFVIALNFLLAWLWAKAAADRAQDNPRMKILSAAALAAALVGLCINSSMTFALYYTDDIRAEQDYALGQRVITRLQEETTVSDGVKPLVFVGEPKLELNAVCVNSEVIGVSMFAYHDNLDGTNIIISEYMKALGLNYMLPSTDDLILAGDLAETMTDFPAEGSILETDEIIVVRFARDPYKDTEFLTAGYAPSDAMIDTFADTHEGSLDGVSCEDGVVTLKGFSLLRGTPSDTMRFQVLLKDTASGAVYEVNTSCAQRLIVSKSYWRDGVNYDACGYLAMFPLELLSNAPDSTFEVVLHCTNAEGDSYYLKTDVYLNEAMVTRNPKIQ